jgi:Coenzyme PQQ synthesis protein D (PqqD).
MLAINNHHLFKLQDSCVLHGIEGLDKYWLFNTENGDHYELNRTSYWILEQLNEKKSFAALLSSLKNCFEIEEEVAVADLKELLTYLVNEGILQMDSSITK